MAITQRAVVRRRTGGTLGTSAGIVVGIASVLISAGGVGIALLAATESGQIGAGRATELLVAEQRAAALSHGVRFEANEGQLNPQVRFFNHGSGGSFYLTDTGAVMVVSHTTATLSGGAHSAHPAVGAAVRMDTVGANRAPQVSGVDQLPGVANYFIGNDPSQWRTQVPSYAAVQYSDVWPGVDMVYHQSRAGDVEYDFVLAPHVDSSIIALQFTGAESVAIDGTGNLILETAGGEIIERVPSLYQSIAGVRYAVAGRYVMRGSHTVGFVLGRHDPNLPLTIDPSLVYSTYLGAGNGAATLATDPGYSTAITFDPSGNTYTTGTTASPSFPTTMGAFQTNPPDTQGGQMAYVTKINASGSAFVFSTYLGSHHNSFDFGGDFGEGIAVDKGGHVYVDGGTDASDFPTTAGSLGSTGCCGFLSKFSASGSKLIYSTYIRTNGSGACDQSGGQDLAVDAAGNAYVPTGNSVQKVNSTGSALLWSFPLPNTATGISSIALDSSGSAYVAGATNPGGDGEIFAAKVNPQGTALVYNYTIAGTNTDCSVGDDPYGIGLDASDNLYIDGASRSGTFPTTSNAYQTSSKGTSDSFVVKLNRKGTALVYSTLVGGSGAEDTGVVASQGGLAEPQGSLAVDAAGHAYVVGETQSADYPVVDPVETPQTQALSRGGVAGIVTELSADGSSLVFSTKIGGEVADGTNGIAVDGNGALYVSGTTISEELPTTARAPEPNFPSDATDAQFVLKLEPVAAGAPVITSVTPSTGPFSGGTAVVLSGSGFTNATAVTFGGVKATFTVTSDTTITTKSPKFVVGTIVQSAAPVTVTTAAGTSAANPVSDYTYGEGGWTSTGATTTARLAAAAVSLPSGKVLLAGGEDMSGNSLSSAELYDPLSGTWSATGSMTTPRTGEALVLLPSGKVLAAGADASDGYTGAELYDPLTGLWTATGSMTAGRLFPSATLLQTGKVLVTDGGSADLYDPTAGTFSATGNLTAHRDRFAQPTVTALTAGSFLGKVLVAGGCCSSSGGSLTSAEYYNPASGTWTGLSQQMTIGRYDQAAAELSDGNAIVAGGYDSTGYGIASVELWNQSTASFALAAEMSRPRVNFQAITLSNGHVLVVGGTDTGTNAGLRSAEIFVEGNPSMLSAGLPAVARGGDDPQFLDFPLFTATVITGTYAQCGSNCGKVLVVGGSGDTAAELYTPVPTVTSISPNTGSHSGGTTVTITGTGLASVTSVLFGGKAGKQVTHDPANPDTQLTVVTPSHATGTVNITVTSPGGTSSLVNTDTYAFT